MDFTYYLLKSHHSYINALDEALFYLFIFYFREMVVAVAAEETRVPAPLPGILKEYTKAAIRTQPRDLLAWSAAYFKYGLCAHYSHHPYFIPYNINTKQKSRETHEK